MSLSLPQISLEASKLIRASFDMLIFIPSQHHAKPNAIGNASIHLSYPENNGFNTIPYAILEGI